jgi:hypothetical protein
MVGVVVQKMIDERSIRPERARAIVDEIKGL